MRIANVNVFRVFLHTWSILIQHMGSLICIFRVITMLMIINGKMSEFVVVANAKQLPLIRKPTANVACTLNVFAMSVSFAPFILSSWMGKIVQAANCLTFPTEKCWTAINIHLILSHRIYAKQWRWIVLPFNCAQRILNTLSENVEVELINCSIVNSMRTRLIHTCERHSQSSGWMNPTILIFRMNFLVFFSRIVCGFLHQIHPEKKFIANYFEIMIRNHTENTAICNVVWLQCFRRG